MHGLHKEYRPPELDFKTEEDYRRHYQPYDDELQRQVDEAEAEHALEQEEEAGFRAKGYSREEFDNARYKAGLLEAIKNSGDSEEQKAD